MGNVNSLDELHDEIDILSRELNNGRLFKLTNDNKRNPNCIDGRDDDCARPSIPGGKFGALGVVLATMDSFKDEKRIPEEQMKKAVSIVKARLGGKLGGHTAEDKKSDTKGCECDGCGHVYRLLHEGTSGKYNLSTESVSILQEQISETDVRNIDVLTGKHLERRVIIVEAEDIGIKSNGTEGQDFVYNAGYAQELYSDLAKQISKLLGISETKVNDKINEVATLHLMSTAKDLAGGLPIFTLKNATQNKEGNYDMLIESSGIILQDETINDKIIDALED